MQKIVSLWKNISKEGKEYYTGKLGELPIIGFYNNDKKNDKQPDLVFYVREEKKETSETKEVKEERNESYDPFAEFGESVNIDDNFLD